MFRILGGDKRGKKLNGPSGFEFRPTTGRVKSFLFSFFESEIRNARILDLFSGTGSLGLEAVSRGASECFFVEQNPNAIQLLKKNIRDCGFETRVRIFEGDVFHTIRRFGNQHERFDFILADPPFKESLRAKIAVAVDREPILDPYGVLIIEHEFHDKDLMQHGLKLLRQKRFGHCVLSLYGKHAFSERPGQGDES